MQTEQALSAYSANPGCGPGPFLAFQPRPRVSTGIPRVLTQLPPNRIRPSARPVPVQPGGRWVGDKSRGSWWPSWRRAHRRPGHTSKERVAGRGSALSLRCSPACHSQPSGNPGPRARPASTPPGLRGAPPPIAGDAARVRSLTRARAGPDVPPSPCVLGQGWRRHRHGRQGGHLLTEGGPGLRRPRGAGAYAGAVGQALQGLPAECRKACSSGRHDQTFKALKGASAVGLQREQGHRSGRAAPVPR